MGAEKILLANQFFGPLSSSFVEADHIHAAVQVSGRQVIDAGAELTAEQDPAVQIIYCIIECAGAADRNGVSGQEVTDEFGLVVTCFTLQGDQVGVVSFAIVKAYFHSVLQHALRKRLVLIGSAIGGRTRYRCEGTAIGRYLQNLLGHGFVGID